jgi:hypothetical protein
MWAVLSLGVAVGCASRESAAGGAASTDGKDYSSGSSAEEEAMAEALANEGSAACEVDVELFQQIQDDGTLKVATKFTNRTTRQLHLKWTAACPGAGMSYEGSLVGYDYGDTCAAGACPGTEDHFSLDLGPEGQAAVGSFVVRPRGSSCNKAIPDGSYTVTPVSEISGARICDAKPGSFSVMAKKITTP